MPHTHLNTLTRETMERHGKDFREARRILGSHGAAARAAKLRRSRESARRADRAREIADRISP